MLERYPRLQALEARVRSDGDRLESEKAARRPRLGLSLRGGGERFASPGGDFSESDSANASLQGQQLLFDGGYARSRIDEALANRSVSEESLHQAAEDLALQLASAYIDVIKYDRLIWLAEANVRAHREALGKIDDKFRAGAGTQADALLAEGRLAMAEAALESRIRQRRAAAATFAKLSGRAPGQLVEPDFPGWALPESYDEVDFSTAPSVRSAQHELRAAVARRRGADSAYRPRLSFVVEGSAAESDRYARRQEDASAMLALSYDFIDGGRRHADANRARSEIVEAEWTLKDAFAQSEAEFADAWIELTAIEERIGLLETHRDAIAAVADAYHQQFEIGQRPLINLLDIENELFSAKSSVEEESLNRYKAAYALLAAKGDLVEAIK